MTARILLGILACLAAGCEFAAKPVAPLSEGGKLVVLTINGPATWYEDAQGQPTGFEHDLVALFAKELDVAVEYDFVVSPEKAEKSALRRAGAPRGGAVAEAFRPAGRTRVGTVLPVGAIPARMACHGPEAARPRRSRGQARGRDRRLLRRPAGFLAAEALVAPRAPAARHLARGTARARGRRPAGRGDHRFRPLHGRAQAFPAARRGVRRRQAGRLRVARRALSTRSCSWTA